MCGAREKVLLGAAIEIGQSIVVSSFYNEIACLGAQLYACSACNAVVEFVVYGLAVLFRGLQFFIHAGPQIGFLLGDSEKIDGDWDGTVAESYTNITVEQHGKARCARNGIST